MEVMRSGREASFDSAQWLHACGVDCRLLTFADLDVPRNHEERLSGDGETLGVEGFPRNEEVGDAIFVFERDETVTFGGAWTLTADHEAGNFDRSSVAQVM